MNFYKFINSKDVRKYLKEVNYQFSILEAAFVVYHSTSNIKRQDGDITDMGFSVYYMEKDGINHRLYWNHGEYYLSLEYYEKDFALR